VAENRARILDASRLSSLLEALMRREYEVIGPTARDGAIVFAAIEAANELPAGWTDEQAPGQYRLRPREDQAVFGYAVGPQSWKRYLHPPVVRLWSAERQDGTFRILNNEPRPKRRFAFLGVRPCDLAAITVQDRVLTQDRYCDPVYASRRNGTFVVAVQCTQAAPTCFCLSMGTGPRAQSGFDLALTELIDRSGHCFLVEPGSERGIELLAELETTPATDENLRQVKTVEAAARQQVRHIDNTGIKDLLYQNFEHPRWDNVAGRCLTCANCTMVCPTCFCTTVEDLSDITGNHAERSRRWDSCFTLNFSYIHGGSVRASARSRYRQWMTHKLASWIDQFGTSGCVGCGRCITWCPVGIDITEEVHALREGGESGNP